VNRVYSNNPPKTQLAERVHPQLAIPLEASCYLPVIIEAKALSNITDAGRTGFLSANSPIAFAEHK